MAALIEPMKFPYTVWVIAIPEGGHCTFLLKPTRAECIAAFNAWHPDMKWPQAQREGWRCVKMNCSPA